VELLEWLLGPVLEFVAEFVLGEIAKVLAVGLEILKSSVMDLFR
jgi:hypothetical protein